MKGSKEIRESIKTEMEILEARYSELKEKERVLNTEMHDIRVAMDDLKALKTAIDGLEEFDRKYSKENEG